MLLNTQIPHGVIVFAAFLAVISGLQYLKYKTPTTSWAGFFLFSLAGELLSFAFQLMTGPETVHLHWFILQAVFFFLFVIFWSMFIIAMAGFSRKINVWIVLSIFASSSIVMFLLQDYPLPLSWNLDSLINIEASIFELPALFGQTGRFFIAFFYGIGAVCTLFLLRYLLGPEEKFKNLILPMFLGNIFFYSLGVLEHAGIDPFKPLHLTQLGLVFLSLLIFVYAVVWRFGGILPLSRESVFEGLRDGILLLDWENKVVDLNHAAQNILEMQRGNVVRKPLAQVWPAGDQIIQNNPGKDFIVDEAVFTVDDQEYTFGVNISRLFGVNQSSMGSMLVLRNITSRERMEVALHDRARELQRTNAFLGALAEVNLKIHDATDPSKIMSILGNELKNIHLNCFIAQLDNSSQELKLAYFSVESKLIQRAEKLLGIKAIGYGLDKTQFSVLYEMLESNQVSYSVFTPTDLETVPGKLSLFLLGQAVRAIGIEPDAHTLVLPLFTNEHRLGLMGVWGEDMVESDIPSFRLFANQVANVMDRALLFDEQMERSTELARVNSLTLALSEVASVISATANSKIVLNTLGRELKKTGLDCAVASIDSENQIAYLNYLSFNPKLIQQIEKMISLKLENFEIPRKYWPGAKIIEEQTPAWYAGPKLIFRRMFPMLPDRIVFKALDLLKINDDQQLCFLPLVHEKLTIGVMVIWGPALKVNDSPILSVFSSQVASIIQNISSLEQQVQRTGELKRTNAMIIALSRVASQLNTILDLERVYHTLGEELLTVKVNCMVGLLNDSRDALLMEYVSMSPKAMKLTSQQRSMVFEKISIPRKLWPSEDVVTKGIAYWDDDPVESTLKMFPFIPKGIFKKAYQLTGIGEDGDICYLPMINNEVVIGVLAMWGQEIRREDLPALTIFAHQVAIAVSNIRLYNQAQKEIDERKQAEAGVREALEEKEVLLKEVHHRVKNNLQVISSLLNLQSSQIDDSKTVDILRESQNRVRSMALIHEKLYQSSDLAQIDFGEYLRSLVSSLRQTYRMGFEKVVIEVTANDIIFDIDTAIPCGLIVNELVSNSLKYAFSKGAEGKIKVMCEKRGPDQYKLIVQDDGIGLPDGFKPGEGNSLGLKLVNSLVRQLDGELQVENHRGARFEIEFSELETD